MSTFKLGIVINDLIQRQLEDSYISFNCLWENLAVETPYVFTFDKLKQRYVCVAWQRPCSQ